MLVSLMVVGVRGLTLELAQTLVVRVPIFVSVIVEIRRRKMVAPIVLVTRSKIQVSIAKIILVAAVAVDVAMILGPGLRVAVHNHDEQL